MSFSDVSETVTKFFSSLTKATADSLAWFSILIFNAATIPTFIAVMSGHSQKMPPLDIVIMIWIGLLMYFIRSVILKDMLMTVTIGLGFAAQAIFLGVIFFV